MNKNYTIVLKILIIAIASLFLVATGFSIPTKQKQVIRLNHLGYVTYYNTRLRYPVRVEWWNTRARLECPDSKVVRKYEFEPDPLLPIETDLAADYSGSGLDRGHMCPVADNSCIDDLKMECFYLSNVSPQYHSLNAGDWKRLETRTRELSIKYDSVMVWCGSIGIERKIGKISIPTRCWKVIFVKRTNLWEAYVFNNTPEKPAGLERWRVKKEDVEKLTGYKFSIR